MQNQELDLFLAEDWVRTKTELIQYAESVAFKKIWRSADSLPKGMEPPDVALEAIRKTFEWIKTGNEGSGYRKWNRKAHPTLLEHLKSAVDSELSNLVTKKEHLATNYSAHVDQETSAAIFEESVSDMESTDSPESVLLKKEQLSDDDRLLVLLPKIYEALSGKDIARQVLLSFQELAERNDDVKPQRVAKEIGCSIEDVYNALKQIRRVASKVCEEKKGENI